MNAIPTTTKTRWVGGAIAVVAVMAGTIILVGGPSTHGGDADGRILADLRPVLMTIPAGSSMLSSGTHESMYSKKCPDNPGGRSGWDYVSVGATFRSDLSGPVIIQTIGHNLEAQGWHVVPIAWDHNAWQLAPLAEWAKPVAHGRTAHAVVYQYPGGFGEVTGAWYLSGVAKPPGFALAGC